MDALPIIPARYMGEGEFKSSSPHWQRIADEHFVVGQIYDLRHEEPRSGRSHNHYFAELKDAWRNLPERWAKRLPTVDHLRAYALIRTGFADSRTFPARSASQAIDLRDFLRPCDPFSIVTADAATVTIWTAQSQSLRAMGKDKFQDSKNKVLDYAASLIAATREDLSRNAREVA